MKGSTTLARYDIAQSYDWNYLNPPQPIEIDAPACPGDWDFCGLPIDSPLGVPAGPLLNSGWILYYASLGFSVLTYKPVRSSYRPCYEPPNLLPVRAAPLMDSQSRVTIAIAGAVIDSWAISFGMK